MYLPYVKEKDEGSGKETLIYLGICKNIEKAKKKVGNRKGFIKDYNTKRIVFQNMV